MAPFDADGPPGRLPPRPLPETEFPTVRRAVADVPDARQFLEALKFTEPDVVAEVLENILPRYASLDVAAIWTRHSTRLTLIGWRARWPRRARTGGNGFRAAAADRLPRRRERRDRSSSG